MKDVPEESFDRERWSSIYLEGIDPFIETPRHIVRLVNTLRVTYPSVATEVSAVDFIAIEAARVFAPEVYSVIRQNRNFFAGQEPSGMFGTTQDELRQFHDGWLHDVPASRQQSVKRLVSHLFPKTAYAWGGSGHAGDWETRWRRELRVCSPDIFPIYFRFSVPAGGVSTVEMRTLLQAAADASEFAGRLESLSSETQPDGSTRLRAFLERLPDHAEDLPLESIRSALHGVYNAADRLLGLDDEPVDWLAAANDILISRFAFRLLERLSEPERYRLLLELVQSAKALGVIVYELTLLGQEQGRYGTSGGLPSDQWAITEEHLNALEKAALKRIRSMSRNEPRELLPFRKLASLMYRWREWGKLPEVRRWATRVVVDDDALLRLLEEFLVLGSANGRRTYAVRVNSLREFFDPNKVADRVRFLASDPEIDKLKHVAAQEFVRSYDGKGSGSD